jgi:MFS family permease
MKRYTLLIVIAINFIEWLEFSLYLYLAKTVFANEFFPRSDYSLMLTFALFTAAYLARPVGGWLFGRQADLKGRRKPMMVSAGLMGAATIGICLLPGYTQIGILATWLLLLFRLLQGLALGGEINTSAMFIIEHHPQKPLIAGSMIAVAGALGMFAGGATAAIIKSCQIPYLWRFVFAVLGFISLSICQLRKQLSESPEFDNKQNLNFKQLWQLHWQGMINIAAAGAYVSVTVYLCNIFWLTFASEQQLWSSAQCAWVGAFVQLGAALLALPLARFSAPEMAGKLLQRSMLLIVIAAPALFYFTYYKIVAGVIFSLLGYMLANGLMSASLYYFLYQQLPSQYRCRGVSVIWALAAIIGALALPLAQAATTIAKLYWLPGFMVSSVALVALLIISYNFYKIPVKIKSDAKLLEDTPF